MAFTGLFEKDEKGQVIICPSIVEEIKRLDSEIATLKAKSDDLKNTIKKQFTENGYSKTETLGSIQVIVVPSFFSLKLDEEKLKKEYPHIYNECLIPTYSAEQKKVQLVRKRRKKMAKENKTPTWYYDAENHKGYYKGKLIPSVTQLVDLLYPLEKGISASVLAKASERGTRIHEDIERWCGGFIDECETQEGINYVALVKAYDLIPVDNEITIFIKNKIGDIVSYGHVDGIWRCGSYIYFDTNGALKIEKEPIFNGGEKIVCSKGDYVMYDNKTVADFDNEKVALQLNLYCLGVEEIPIKHVCGVWVRDEKAQIRPLTKYNAIEVLNQLLEKWEETQK